MPRGLQSSTPSQADLRAVAKECTLSSTASESLPWYRHLTQDVLVQVRPNVLELGMQGKRKVNPHYLDSYRTALQAAMVLQFTRRGTPRGRAGVLALGQNKAMRAIFAAEG